jgi:SAM-dependent methyltransferase
MPKVRESRYWETLLDRYPRSPSIALCRVPEVEFLASLELKEPVLDHCCGDGYIAEVCFPGRILEAGVDFSEPALAISRQRGKYRNVVHADAGKHIPVPDASFGTVFNNSGIEHIDNLDGAIREISRVLKPGGTAHLNVLNSRYFDWWPHPPDTAADYRRYQPFHHALDEAGWSAALERHGLGQVRFRDYFPRPTAEVLADYDYRYSAFYFRRRLSPAVGLTVVAPPGMLRARWRQRFGDLEWMAAPGQGAGFMITATRIA